jgi:hypothetical protein
LIRKGIHLASAFDHVIMHFSHRMTVLIALFVWPRLVRRTSVRLDQGTQRDRAGTAQQPRNGGAAGMVDVEVVPRRRTSLSRQRNGQPKLRIPTAISGAATALEGYLKQLSIELVSSHRRRRHDR